MVVSGESKLTKTVKNLTSLISEIKDINSEIQKISRLALEQNQNIDNIRTSINSDDEITQTNAGISQEIASTTSVVEDKIKELIDKISTFKTE